MEKEQLWTPPGIIAYEDCFEPNKGIPKPGFKAPEPKYGITLMWPEESFEEKCADLIERVTEFARSSFGKKLPKLFFLPYKNGSEVSDNARFQGFVYLRFSTRYKPQVFGQVREPIPKRFEDDPDYMPPPVELVKGDLLPGMMARASYNFYKVDYEKKGVSIGFNAVQRTDTKRKDLSGGGGNVVVDTAYDMSADDIDDESDDEYEI